MNEWCKSCINELLKKSDDIAHRWFHWLEDKIHRCRDHTDELLKNLPILSDDMNAVCNQHIYWYPTLRSQCSQHRGVEM